MLSDLNLPSPPIDASVLTVGETVARRDQPADAAGTWKYDAGDAEKSEIDLGSVSCLSPLRVTYDVGADKPGVSWAEVRQLRGTVWERHRTDEERQAERAHVQRLRPGAALVASQQAAVRELPLGTTVARRQSPRAEWEVGSLTGHEPLEVTMEIGRADGFSWIEVRPLTAAEAASQGAEQRAAEAAMVAAGGAVRAAGFR